MVFQKLKDKEIITSSSYETNTRKDVVRECKLVQPLQRKHGGSSRKLKIELPSVRFRRSVVSNSLQPHGLKHARLPCSSPAPGACSNSCSLSQWCHPTILSSVIPLLFLSSTFPSIRVFSKQSALHIWWPKYYSFSFSINPSNEYSGLISFRIDWLDLLAVQGTQESSTTPQFKSINSIALSFLYGPTLTSIHDYWKFSNLTPGHIFRENHTSKRYPNVHRSTIYNRQVLEAT